MLAAVMNGRGGLRIDEVPVPRVPKGGALLRVTAVGICGSDIHKFAAVPEGTILGHEVAGVVEKLGAGARGFRVGDRLIAAHHVPCGRCLWCRRGNHSQCELFRSTNIAPGGWAERIALSGRHLRNVAFEIPGDMDDGVASLTEPLACCVRAVSRSGVRRGDTVVVVGLGPVGLMLSALFKMEGANVLAFDIRPDKTRFAAKWAGAARLPADPEGALRSIARRTKNRGADQVVLSAGAGAAFPWSLRAARRGGSVHLFSAPDEGTPVDVELNMIYKREIMVLVTYSSSPGDLREAFRLIRKGAIPAAGLITHRLPLTRIEEGLELIRAGKALKVILEPGR